MKNNLLSTITEIKSNYYKKMSMKSQITTFPGAIAQLHCSLFFCITRLTSSPPSSLFPAGPGIPQTTLHKLSEINSKFLTNLHQTQSLVVCYCPLSVWGGHSPQSISFFFFHVLINPLRFWFWVQVWKTQGRNKTNVPVLPTRALCLFNSFSHHFPIY